MINTNKIREQAGNVGGKRVQIISNTLTEIKIRVDGVEHKISTVGKSAKELGLEIRSL